MANSVKIDLFSDPVCPWCLVGLSRLDNAIAALPDDVSVEIAHHPFLLDASAPPEGEDVVEMLTRKYGVDPSEAWDRLESEARASGVELNMRKQKTRYPSQRAQGLIMAAGPRGTQHKLARAIGDACYLDAKNISDVDVLVELGTQHGFSEEEVGAITADDSILQAVEQAAASASAQGVQGVPFFIFDQKFAMSGAQPETVFSQAFATAISGEEPTA